MKVMVGMSGGVDSSAAAVLIMRQYDTAGVTLQLFGDGISKDAEDARAVCEILKIPHYVLPLKEQFAKYVIDDFINEYKNGRTPNPCIQCNKHIKFGGMLEFAVKEGYDKIATGHYARIEKCGERYLLKKAADASKDQSYVLYCLTQSQLSRLILPLGGYTKGEIREIAQENGLITAHKSDSQDICFVPDGDYAAFISRRTGESFSAGDYIDENGEILGRHKGVIHYTVGQRKGLGIALGKPAFVLSKDAQTNRVVLSCDEQKLFYRRVKVENINIIAADTLDGVRAACKLRYRHTEQPCVIHQTDSSSAVIEFEEPQRAPSAGQSAVFYDGDTVLGGGIIVKGID